MWFVLEILLWLDVGLLGLTYVGYPIILRMVGGMRPRPVTPGDGEAKPVTLVVSLYNEEAVIREKIANALDLEGAPQPFIILADDGSTDGSEVICAAAAAEHPTRIRHVTAPRGGKNRALNLALEAIDEGIVVFTDANAMYDSDAIQKIAEAFEDPTVGCVVGRLRYHAGGETMEGAYWRYEDRVKRLESDVGSLVVGNGAILAVRRNLIPELLPGVANDLQIPLAVAARGARSFFQTEAVAREHMSETHGEEYGRKVRMATRGLSHAGAMMRLAPGALKLQFVLHKLLRWLTGVALVEILALSIALALARGGIYSWVLGAQGGFYLLALVGHVALRWSKTKLPLVRFPYYFTVMHLAGLHATWNVLRGRRVEIWESPASTRRPGDGGGAANR